LVECDALSRDNEICSKYNRKMASVALSAFQRQQEKSARVSVPDMKAGWCLGSEENRVSMGEGSEGWPTPPERGRGKQLMPNKGRDNIGKDEEEHLHKLDVMEEDRHKQSEQSSDQARTFCKRDC
jgi:hypothetical protein